MELLVVERDWEPPRPRFAHDQIVGVRVAFVDVAVRDRVKQAGGTWNPERRVWPLRYDRVAALGLTAHLVFVDESGFLLIPSVHKTWAPRGQTPIIRHRYQRDKISVISGISVSPVRGRLGLYWRFLVKKNFTQPDALAFLRHLLHHLRGHVIVLWDQGRIHKGDPLRDFCRRFPRLHLEHFPAYAPELNPDEGVWRLAKARLANGRPDDVDELLARLTASLLRIARSPVLLRACILKSDLPFF